MKAEKIDRFIRELSERQKSNHGWGSTEKPTRKGAFKFSAQEVTMLKKEAPDLWKKTGGPDALLFSGTLKKLNAIPYNDLPKFFGKDNMPDAQDYLAYHPKKAMQLFLQNASKVYAPLGKAVRAYPETVPLYFYAIMRRVSGNDMAMQLFKRYFSTEQYYKPRKKNEGIEDTTDRVDEIVEGYNIKSSRTKGGFDEFGVSLNPKTLAADLMGVADEIFTARGKMRRLQDMVAGLVRGRAFGQNFLSRQDRAFKIAERAKETMYKTDYEMGMAANEMESLANAIKNIKK